MIESLGGGSISSLAELASLFDALGYDCALVPFDGATCAGVAGEIFFAGEWGSLDLYLSEELQQGDASTLVSRLSSRNALRTIAVATAKKEGGFSIHVGRFAATSSVAFPEILSEAAIERLNLLRLTNDRYVDPGELFAQFTSRENVTRAFFKRFSHSVTLVTSELRTVVSRESEEECRRQAILILSRLLFLHFVQRRGWLHGAPRYLLDRFRAAERQGRLFYATDLLPLFFGCLNTPVSERQADVATLGHVPYLNGGLFHPSRFELANADAILSNTTIGEVLTKTFEPFSFVVDEKDSGGSSVDPEMLGRVFESLMAEEERLRSGTFYTPRDVVDSMSAEALAAWLADGNEGLAGQLQRLAAGENVPLSAATATALLARLARVRVLDPACGSGAFLLSALYVIERLTAGLRCAAALPSSDSVRRQVIESSLFGVDLKSEAVRLCELRLWLSIVVAEECSIDELIPLPNLDRNIFQGNSLFNPVDALTTHRMDVYRDWLYAFRSRTEMIDNYRHAAPQLKRVLGEAIRKSDRELVSSFARRAIDLYEADEEAIASQGAMFEANHALSSQPDPRIATARDLLARAEGDELDFFAFEVHFGHVLADGGFDVIVGNPPWVRHSRLSVDDRRRLSDRYSFFRGEGGLPRQSDLAVAFCEKGVGLLAAGGVLSFLLPSKVLSAGYATQMRRVIGTECEIRSLRDFSGRASALFDADTFPLAMTLRRTTPGAFAVAVSSTHGDYELAQSEVIQPTGVWSLAPPRARRILERLASTHESLQQVLNRAPLMGVKTGANRLFMLDDVSFDRGSAVVGGSVRIPLDALCRTVRGRDIERWRVRQSSWMFWSPAHRWDGCAWLDELATHFSTTREELYLSYVRPEHLGTKVAWKDLSRGLQAVVLPASSHVSGHEFPLIPNQTLYFLDVTSVSEAYALSAILNSTVFGALAVDRCERAKDNHFRYFGRSLAQLPLALLEERSASYSELVKLGRQAHVAAPADELDRVVADLYAVSSAELEVLRRYLGERLGS